MSSFPSVAASWQPTDPMESYAKMAELQQRLRQGEQDAQQRALDLQKTRMGLEQTQAMNTAFQNALSPPANAAPQAATPGRYTARNSASYGRKLHAYGNAGRCKSCRSCRDDSERTQPQSHF
jgi:hypothetical protein